MKKIWILIIMLFLNKCGVTDPDIPDGFLGIEIDATGVNEELDNHHFEYIQSAIKRIRPGTPGDTIYDISFRHDNLSIQFDTQKPETIDVEFDDFSTQLWRNYDYYRKWTTYGDSWCLYICGVKHVLIRQWDRDILLGICFRRTDTRGEARCAVAYKFICSRFSDRALSVIKLTTAHEIGHAFNLLECFDDECIMYRVPNLEDIQDRFCNNCSRIMKRQKP